MIDTCKINCSKSNLGNKIVVLQGHYQEKKKSKKLTSSSSFYSVHQTIELYPSVNTSFKKATVESLRVFGKSANEREFSSYLTQEPMAALVPSSIVQWHSEAYCQILFYFPLFGV